jgi:hypothetical protein
MVDDVPCGDRKSNEEQKRYQRPFQGHQPHSLGIREVMTVIPGTG